MNLIRLFPWVYAILELFLILPASLYLGGKIMKLQHEKFTFGSCIWINFIAGLLAGLAVELNQWLALGVFLVLVAVMVKRQFQASNGTTAVVVVITVLIAVGLSYLKPIIFLNLLGIPV